MRLKVLLRMNRMCLEVLGFSLDDLRRMEDLGRLPSSVQGLSLRVSGFTMGLCGGFSSGGAERSDGFVEGVQQG